MVEVQTGTNQAWSGYKPSMVGVQTKHGPGMARAGPGNISEVNLNFQNAVYPLNFLSVGPKLGPGTNQAWSGYKQSIVRVQTKLGWGTNQAWSGHKPSILGVHTFLSFLGLAPTNVT